MWWRDRESLVVGRDIYLSSATSFAIVPKAHGEGGETGHKAEIVSTQSSIQNLHYSELRSSHIFASIGLNMAARPPRLVIARDT